MSLRNFFVAYDLFAPDRNFTTVIDEIYKLGRVAELVRSVWYVKSELDEAAIRDRLRVVLNPQDRLVVIAASNAYGFGLDRALWDAVRAEWAK